MCRFEIQIKDKFQCAVISGFDGWAYLWKHNNTQDPCINCPLKIEGKPLVVGQEVKADGWGVVAGKLIRARDWKEFKKRGYKITRSGYSIIR